MGVDPSAGMLQSAQKNIETKAQQQPSGTARDEYVSRFQWVEGSVEKFEYPEESVDLVISGEY